MIEKESVELIATSTTWGGEFAGVKASSIFYHQQTGQTVILASMQYSGSSYSLWCWLKKGSSLFGPVNLDIPWNTEDQVVYIDGDTGMVLLVTWPISIVRINITDGSVSAVGPISWTSFGTTSHPVDGVSLEGSHKSLCVTSSDDFYCIGDRTGVVRSLAARRCVWTGSTYAVSSDPDIILDENRHTSSQIHAYFRQGKFALIARRHADNVTTIVEGTASVGSLNAFPSTVFNAGLTRVNDQNIIDLSTTPPVSVFIHNDDSYTYITTPYAYGFLSGDGAMALGGEYPFTMASFVKKDFAPCGDTGVLGVFVGADRLLFINPQGGLLQDRMTLVTSGHADKGAITYSPHDKKFYATAYETHYLQEIAQRGLNLFTLSAPPPQFWTNFVGQSERPA